MARHTTFRFCLDPTVEQSVALARHAGAARFAYNQCLRLHLDARGTRRPQDLSTDDGGSGVDGGRGASGGGEGPAARVPWSRFGLINAFNSWKRSEAAGRRFLVAGDGVTEIEVTGLAWRGEVSAEAFEEAAVDVSRALAAWTESRRGKRKGRRVGHPRFKRKSGAAGSFRMRNKTKGTCGLVLDRDLNAAANLAAWAQDHARGEAQDGDRQAAGPVINACRRDGTGPRTRVSETSPDDAGTPARTAHAA